MRIKITYVHGYSNPRRGIKLACGEVASVSDDLAAKLINTRLAVPAPRLQSKPKPVTETAAKAPPENMAKRASKALARKLATAGKGD